MHLVVGADSLLGASLLRELRSKGIHCRGTGRSKQHAYLDLEAPPSKWEIPNGVQVVYLMAAVTSQRICEKDPERSRLTNVERTLELAQHPALQNAFVVFPSTSVVYDGSIPYPEPPLIASPVSEYARQKAMVEQVLMRDRPNSAIVRMTKVVHHELNLFRQWAIDLKAGHAVVPFSDMSFSPIPLAHAVELLQLVATRRASGIFQTSSSDQLVYAEAAETLASQLGFPLSLIKSQPAGVDTPRYSTLGTSRLRTDLGIIPPNSHAVLLDTFKKLQSHF